MKKSIHAKSRSLILGTLLFAIIAVLFVGCGKEGEDEREQKEHKHVWVEADCVAPKHCEECGQTIGEAIGHSWAEATCTSPKRCTRCGKTEGAELGHTWQAATCTTPETCLTCGETKGSPLGHDTSSATCTEGATCNRCGEAIMALGHDWEAATCTEPQVCKRCGVTEGEALGHSWKEATCTMPKTCTRCKEKEGDALGHEWVEATCKEAKHCSRCGEKDGLALGHSFEQGKCVRCGEQDPKYIPPETFENNKYYEIIEEAQFTNSIGYTIVVKKVMAKKNASISATFIAYDSKGDVIGKSTDDIILTAGETNFFLFTFENSISKATIETSYKVEDDSWLAGARDAVEMVKYNRSGDYLYITFKQTKEEMGSFAKFKILLYKGDKIVGTEWSYFSVSATNLTGKDTTDIAQLWVWGEKFDKIEYIFEP